MVQKTTISISTKLKSFFCSSSFKTSRHNLALRQLKSHQSCLKEDNGATFEKICFTGAIQGKSVEQGNSILIFIASLTSNHIYICINSRYCI